MTDYLLQQGREKYYPLLNLVSDIHGRWAEDHNLTYLAQYGAILPDLPGYWDSVKLMLDLATLPSTDYIFWLDADTLIVGDGDPRAAMGDALVAMARHPGPPEHYNCGVLFLRACKQVTDWLQKVLDGAPGVHPWYQQDFMNEYLKEPQWAGKVKTLPHEWNSTVVLNHPPECIVRAWHGFPGDRCAAMRAEIERRGL